MLKKEFSLKRLFYLYRILLLELMSRFLLSGIDTVVLMRFEEINDVQIFYWLMF